MQAPNKRILARYLASRSLQPTEINEYRDIFGFLNRITFGKTIKDNDLIFILKQIAAMLTAGIRLSDAIEIIAIQTTDKVTRRILYDLFFDLEAGKMLSEAMERYPQDFPKLTRNMLEIGETNGDLLSAVENLAIFYENTLEVRNDIRSALTMPIIYIIMGIAVAAVMIIFVVPSYSALFASTGGDLPVPTQILVNVGDFFTNNWLNVLFMTAAISFLLYYLFAINEKGRRIFAELMIRTPIIGQLVIMSNQSTISSTLSQMVNNKVRMIEAVLACTKIVKNEVYKEVLEQTVINLRTGASITKEMDNHYAFTQAFTKMLSMGESTGTLPKMLENLSEFTANDVKLRSKRLRRTIEPTIMLVIYVMVGFLVMAVMLPSLTAIGNI
jgi:type II secretory pathway component PulF